MADIWKKPENDGINLSGQRHLIYANQQPPCFHIRDWWTGR